MLEINHLSKVYSAKNCTDVVALDDVSLKLPGTGMVFITGKSGSGKSTLLNLIGMLDSFTSGDVIVDGKHAKDFSERELDNYRNTYLGFVFQEYYLIDTENVFDNIAFALRIQNRKIEDKVVLDVLKQVGLEGYEKRAVTELSGGQKQRVSIARALIKKPKIILADEPTGALDSKTGKQILDLLKEVSKSCLVILVSHDESFAMQFGDRIIELTDGRISHDFSPEEESDDNRVFYVSGNRIFINSDCDISKDEMEKIKIVQQKHPEYVIRSVSFKDRVRTSKKEERSTESKPLELISSRYPFHEAFKMGIKSIRKNPFRLALTVLLSSVAFALAGSAIGLETFDMADAYQSIYRKYQLSYLPIYSYQNRTSSGLQESDVKEIEEQTDASVYLMEPNVIGRNLPLILPKNVDEYDGATFMFYKNSVAIDDSFLENFGYPLVAGRIPKNSKEVCITKCEYQMMKKYGIDTGYYRITSDLVDYDSILNMEMGNRIVTGIIDTGFPEEYLSYSAMDASEENEAVMQTLSQNSIHLMTFTYNDDDIRKEPEFCYLSSIQGCFDGERGTSRISSCYESDALNDDAYFFRDDNSLGGNNVLVTPYLYSQLYMKENPLDSSRIEDYLKENYVDRYSKDKKEFIENNYQAFYSEHSSDPFVISEYQREKEYGKEDEESIKKTIFTKYAFDIRKGDYRRQFRKKFFSSIFPKLVTEFPLKDKAFDLSYKTDISSQKYEKRSYKAIGLYLQDSALNDNNLSDSSYLVSDQEFDQFKSICPMTNRTSLNRIGFVGFAKSNGNPTSFMKYYSELIRQASNKEKKGDYSSLQYKVGLEAFDHTHELIDNFLSFIPMFAIASAILILFSSLLFFNFISISINNREKEIGILRALGVEKKDVFAIFFSEAFLLAIVNFAISIGFTFIVAFSLNGFMANVHHFSFHLLDIRAVVVFSLLGISLLAAFVSSVLPVYRIASKKPVDAINGK